MTLKIENRLLPGVVKNSILSKNCVVFLGSGLSNERYGSWPDLVNSLCERTGIRVRVTRDCEPEKYLEAAESAKRSNPTAYHQYLGELFGQPVKQLPILFVTLFTLPFASYLTSNFDPLLALQARALCLECCTYPSLDRKKIGKKSVHYLHGKIDENTTPIDGTVVLTQSDFCKAYAPDSTLKAFLAGSFENDPLLFIGCRLKEPVMAEVFKIARERQAERQRLCLLQGKAPGNPPPRFIFLQFPKPMSEKNEIDQALRQKKVLEMEDFYSALGIQPVWYDDHEILRPALEQLSQIPSRPEFDWGASDAV